MVTAAPEHPFIPTQNPLQKQLRYYFVTVVLYQVQISPKILLKATQTSIKNDPVYPVQNDPAMQTIGILLNCNDNGNREVN
jgi:hypothetical protein